MVGVVMEKIVLVTGGASGIGLGTVNYLLDTNEYKVISVTRSKESINNAKNILGNKFNKVDYILGDVSREDDCNKIYTEIKNKYGKLDGLVNCAGVMRIGGLEKCSIEEWNYTIINNLTAPFVITKILLPLLKLGNNPSIVNVSSIASTLAGKSTAYSASKAGLDLFTKCSARELAKYNIRVNSVNPGNVRSNILLSAGIFKSKEEYEKDLEETKDKYPLGRTGEPEDIAPAIEFLLSEKSLWTTGAILTIDGGRSVLV
jgi:NAD(P)-dependent dehydrogenase (short-subunit alcohol dehydrogenase family)